MSRVPLLQSIFEATVREGQFPAQQLVEAEGDPTVHQFYDLCARLAGVRERQAAFSKVEKKGKNWFAIFEFSPERKYRWQMPDEDAARAVERAGMGGGGFAMARRKALRSYKWNPETEKWALLRIKNSKKWRAESKARAKAKRAKRRRRRKRQRILEMKLEQEALALLEPPTDQGEES
jgi:hypothetical protein